MEYYKILGIPQQADENQIKQAYRKLAKKYHPDLNPDNPDAEAKFKDVVEAYETLGDPEKRRKYDETFTHSSGAMGAKTRVQNNTHNAPGVDFGSFTKNMEQYFGFSFQQEQPVKQKQNSNGNKKNPLDVTEMFEAFMKIK